MASVHKQNERQDPKLVEAGASDNLLREKALFGTAEEVARKISGLIEASLLPHAVNRVATIIAVRDPANSVLENQAQSSHTEAIDHEKKAVAQLQAELPALERKLKEEIIPSLSVQGYTQECDLFVQLAALLIPVREGRPPEGPERHFAPLNAKFPPARADLHAVSQHLCFHGLAELTGRLE